jgi:hypothetical protein
MDRRKFLSALIGGVAAAAAVRECPFRAFSFPKEIKYPDFGGQTLFADYDKNGNLTNWIWEYDPESGFAKLHDSSFYDPTGSFMGLSRHPFVSGFSKLIELNEPAQAGMKAGDIVLTDL